jgi:hypothetical protein
MSTEVESMMAKPQKEHRWLDKLVGEWIYETEAQMAPGKPAEKAHGSESVKSIGGLWIVAQGHGEMPGGGAATMIMTLGYNPETGKYVGTWIGSMMTHMWVYDGSLDAAEKVLTLNSDGPDFTVKGKMAKYQDIIEIENDDTRVLRSQVLGEDGKWHQFMTARYTRRT